MAVRHLPIKRIQWLAQIAVRFLFSKTQGRFFSLVSTVSISGVCVGVLALLLVTSVINGYEKEITELIAGTQVDVIFYSRGSPIREHEKLQVKLRQLAPQITTMTASVVSQVMFSGPAGVAGGMLEGVDPITWGDVVRIDSKLRAGGRLPLDESDIVLGSALAERIGIQVGDSVRVTLPFTGGDEEGGYGTPKVQDFNLVGIVHFGMYDYDSKYAYSVLPAVQQFVYGENKPWITTFRMKVEPKAVPSSVAFKLMPHFGFPYKILDWSQLNKNLLYAIQLEKAVITVLLTAIMVVAAFNVISALLLLVYEKEKEIAILRVLGTRKKDQFILFAFLGSFFGVAGTGLAVILGWISTQVLQRVRIIELPPDIYHLEYLPVVIRWTEWSAIAFMAFMICFLATIGPAMQVSRRSPVEGLRWNG